MRDHPIRRAVLLVPFAMGIVPLGVSTAASAAEASRPNVIYILADDLGYGDPGCYGQKTLRTPNLDKMADEGMRFTEHYAGSTVCAPSRCVLLTGLHSGHACIRNNSEALLEDEDRTVAKVLRAAGYRTGCCGKWGVGHPPPNHDPNRCGFDYFYGYVSMYHAHNFFPEFIIRNGRREALRNVLAPRWRERTDGAGVAEKKIDYVPDLIHREALAFIDRNRNRPFFLYYALNMPHANNEGGSSPHGMEVPDYGEFDSRDWPANEKGFARMIQLIDGYVGEVLAKLNERGLEERTVVFFSSDNGPHQEGGHVMEFFNSNGQLRGMKRDLYEGGIRVPLIVRWPGKIEAKTVSGHVSGFQDMMPTLAELAGVDCPATDGISMLPTLLGNSGQQETHEYLYWEFPRRRRIRGQLTDTNKQAVVKGKWKAYRETIGDKVGPIELFDLTNDPSEEHDVAAERPEVVAEMEKIMREATSPP